MLLQLVDDLFVVVINSLISIGPEKYIKRSHFGDGERCYLAAAEFSHNNK